MTFNILFVNSFGNFTLSVITNCRKYWDFGILIEDEVDIYGPQYLWVKKKWGQVCGRRGAIKRLLIKASNQGATFQSEKV